MIETIEGGLLTAIALTAAMFVALEIGHRLGVRALIKDPEPQRGTGAIEGAVFGLIGLILAFTFSGAQSRLDTRRAPAALVTCTWWNVPPRSTPA